MNHQPYDLIGDIHGYADELLAMLAKLGYERRKGGHAHPGGRMVVFLGDYIDRGPKIREVLETVRAMVESGNALAILGNHEVNAMRYHTTGPDGLPLRENGGKKREQHQATLDQIDHAEMREWIDWFAGLPLTLDLGGLRAVHAAWDDRAAAELATAGKLHGHTLVKYSIPLTRHYDTISWLVNGPEAKLPRGIKHRSADGALRRDVRLKWWTDVRGLAAPEAVFPETPDIPPARLTGVPEMRYDPASPPTFFGHYAIHAKRPAPVALRLACLDYGLGKGGFLSAYRWDGETELDPLKFEMIQQGTRP